MAKGITRTRQKMRGTVQPVVACRSTPTRSGPRLAMRKPKDWTKEERRAVVSLLRPLQPMRVRAMGNVVLDRAKRITHSQGTLSGASSIPR